MERRGRPPHPDILTPREWEVLALLRGDLTNAEIAARIGISERGVKYHVSEIIGKLGVRDRHEAAAWYGEIERERRPASLWAPFFAMWHPLRHVPLVAGALVVVIIAAALGVVGWSAMAELGRDSHLPAVAVTSSSPTPVALTSQHTSVLLFDAGAQPSVRDLVDAEGAAFFQWLDGGTRVVGYDWRGHAYEILGVDAGSVDRLYATFAPEPAQPGDRRSTWTFVLPGGAHILIERDGGAPSVYDVASGEIRLFTGPVGANTGFTSIDGTQLIFNNLNDARSTVMISDLYGANTRVLRSNDSGSVGLLGEQPLSPDRKWLMTESSDTTGGAAPETAIVTDMNGGPVWTMPLPNIVNMNIATDIRWWGKDRLLVLQTTPDGNGNLNVLSWRFVQMPTGEEAPAPPELALHLISLSPDGRHAIVSLGNDRGGAWERRCALIEIDGASGTFTELASAAAGPGDYQTVFCASVDWTPDGTRAIVSAGGI